MARRSAPPAGPGSRRRWLVVLAVLAVVGIGVSIYLSQSNTAEPIEVPPLATAGMEKPVATALERARTRVVEAPQSAAAWGQVGLVLFANDLYADSLPWLEQAERLDPKDSRWPYYRGMGLLLIQPAEAIAALTRAVELSPHDPDMRLRLAESLLAQDQIDEADQAFVAVLEARRNDPRALFGRGQILLRRDQAADAVPLLKQAASHPTAKKVAHAALAEAYARLGDVQAAAEQHQLAVAAPNDRPWADPKLGEVAEFQVNLMGRLRRSDALLNSGNVEAAFVILRQALSDRPDSAEAHLSLGKALVRTRQNDGGERALRRAIELDPNLADAHALLGNLLMIRGDAPGAEKHYRKALEVNPGSALTHFNLGQCRLKQGDSRGAIESLKDAIRYRPGNVAAHIALAELYLEAGRRDEALAVLEAAARLEPSNDKVRALLEKARGK